MRKLLCKHICAVIQQPGVGWEALGSKSDTYPLYTLDKFIVQLPPSPNIDSSSPTSYDAPGQQVKEIDEVRKRLDANSTEFVNEEEQSKHGVTYLPYRRKTNIRKSAFRVWMSVPPG
jgi:hypothetical protein